MEILIKNKLEKEIVELSVAVHIFRASFLEAEAG